jgi:hypothetical protein
VLFQYILNVSVFPQSVIDTEIAFYLGQHLNPYGVPLDNRGCVLERDSSFHDRIMWADPGVQCVHKAGLDVLGRCDGGA